MEEGAQKGMEGQGRGLRGDRERTHRVGSSKQGVGQREGGGSVGEGTPEVGGARRSGEYLEGSQGRRGLGGRRKNQVSFCSSLPSPPPPPSHQ